MNYEGIMEVREAGEERIDKLEKYIRIAAKYFDIGTSRRENLYLARDVWPPREVLRQVIK